MMQAPGAAGAVKTCRETWSWVQLLSLLYWSCCSAAAVITLTAATAGPDLGGVLGLVVIVLVALWLFGGLSGMGLSGSHS